MFTTIFLGPALVASGPTSAGAVMAALRARRLLTFLPVVSLLTIGSGARLMWIISGGLSPAYFETPHGRAFGFAGATAMIAFLLAISLVRPSAARSAQLGQAVAKAPDDQRPSLMRELEIVRRRNAWSSAVALTMLVVGAGGMAVARYLG